MTSSSPGDTLEEGSVSRDNGLGTENLKSTDMEITERKIVHESLYSHKIGIKNQRKEVLRSNPMWDRIYIDWKDYENRTLRGFFPGLGQYKELLKKLMVKEEEILRINDCKSGAGYLVVTFKKPINIIERFQHVSGRLELEEEVGFQVRGLENLRKIQKPIEVIVSNGSEVDLTCLKEIMERYGELVGDIVGIPHSIAPKNVEEEKYLSSFSSILSGKMSFKIKPKRRLPAVVPIRGRKVELVSELQLLQCFKCLKTGHTKAKCQAEKRTPYAEFEKQFRSELGLTNRIGGAEERQITEVVARAEEEECEETTGNLTLMAHTGGKESDKQQEGESSIKKTGLREEWKRVLRKRTDTTSKSNGSTKTAGKKNGKRVLQSPGEEKGKKHREEATGQNEERSSTDSHNEPPDMISKHGNPEGGVNKRLGRHLEDPSRETNIAMESSHSTNDETGNHIAPAKSKSTTKGVLESPEEEERKRAKGASGPRDEEGE